MSSSSVNGTVSNNMAINLSKILVEMFYVQFCSGCDSTPDIPLTISPTNLLRVNWCAALITAWRWIPIYSNCKLQFGRSCCSLSSQLFSGGSLIPSFGLGSCIVHFQINFIRNRNIKEVCHQTSSLIVLHENLISTSIFWSMKFKIGGKVTARTEMIVIDATVQFQQWDPRFQKNKWKWLFLFVSYVAISFTNQTKTE